MLGATVFELYKQGAALSHGQSLDIAVGFVVSFIVAYVVIRQFLVIVGRYGLTPFGWYRIAAAIALALYIYVFSASARGGGGGGAFFPGSCAALRSAYSPLERKRQR